MRRGRETLLTLLEAFVYDPLVEWGGGGGGAAGSGQTRGARRSRRHARAARDMLAVRAVELTHHLTTLTDHFLAVLPEIEQHADKWLKENEELKSVETRLKECHQQMALIKEIEAYGPNLSSHPLYSISQKYSSYKQAKNAVEDSMKALVKILKDFDTQIENFTAANEAINGPQLMQWVQEFSGPKEDDEKPIFEHIKEFLTNAGQSSMISQCEQAETELNQSMQQTHLHLRSCLELLSQYVAVSQYYPQSHTEYHRIVLFRKWLAAALESKSPEVCREVSNQVTSLVNAEKNTGDSQHIIAYNYRLQAISAEANVALNKATERLQLEGGPETIAMAQESYRDAKANIGNWIRAEEGAVAALECVVVGMLCNLNRRYLMLENGAQSAGDCLVDLTSREGEWFLDDMSSLSMQVVELLSLLPLQSASAEDAALPVAVECVRNANLLIADLVQLNYNFSTIILPEALKKVHSEDPSTLLMINELNAVILNTPVPFNDLLAQLEMHLTYLVRDMECQSPVGGAQAVVASLRARYEALLALPAGADGSGSAGRMLLMGLNGLFAAVELRARELAQHLAAPTPPVWRKIDHINDAMHMSAALQSGAVRSVLEDIFLVRRVQTAAEVFASCARLAAAAAHAPPPTSPASPVPADAAALCRPVRRFTAEFVSRCVLGVASRALGAALCLLLRRARLDLRAEVEQKEIGASWSVSLESLCEKAASVRGCASGALQRARALAGAVQSARATQERVQRAVRGHAAALAHAHCARLRATAHQQLHAEVVGGAGDASGVLVRRARDLSAAADRLGAAVTKAQALLTAAHQRVVWGAGANPALSGVVVSLEEAWGIRAARGAALREAAGALATHQARAAHARARHAHTARTAKQALHHWEKACTVAQKYSLKVSPVEESLMEMLHPEGNIDAQWVGSVSGLVREMVSQLTAEAAAGRARAAAAGAALRNAAAAAAPHAAARLAALQDVRQPLHALQAADEGTNPAGEYLSRERAAYDLVRAVTEVREEEPSVRAARAALPKLTEQLPALVQALIDLPHAWSTQPARRLARQAAVTAPPTRHGGGERNAQGAGVWKRVRLKLEGRDPDQARRLSPHEQVDYIISEATSADNLCMMYEGWMAWV